MRIALRPSGGRGDYELAGSYNELHASNLLEKNFFFQVTPGLTINGKAKASRLAGKPRIRPAGGRHAYIVISSILLLPPPRRELLRTPEALPYLRDGDYTIAGIDIDVVSNEPENVTFAPTSVWAKSRGGLLKVDFAERMAIITTLWNAAVLKKTILAALLKEHQVSVASSDHDRIVQSSVAIQKHYQTKKDVISFLLRDFGLPDASDLAFTGISDSALGFESEDNDSTPDESLRERVRKWRKQADRGPGSREFSIQVREAYDYRCLFSGERFPKLPTLHSAGVDGAHILPWSTHQLNSVVNGICLCKLCHWGFDNGLLRLDFDSSVNEYLLSIPQSIEKIAIEERFDLSPFKRNTGRINPLSLPKNHKLWPSAKHILELNSNL